MKRIWGGVFSLLFVSTAVQALSLDDYLTKVRAKNTAYLATGVSNEAAELRKSQGDLVLSPYFTARASYFDDKKPQAIPAMQGIHTENKDINFGLAKKFASGTALSLGFDQQFQRTEGTMPPFPDAYVGTLTLSLSQSLWRDFFGQATRLRRERESNTARLEKLAQELQARRILVGAEEAYWNYVFQQQDSRIKHASLERAQRLVSWAARRVNSGVSDRSDLLQVQALHSSRDLQMISANDEFLAANKSFYDFIHGEKTPENDTVFDDFLQSRDIKTLAGGGGNLLRFDAVVQAAEAKVKAGVASEVNESLKPDLSLSGAVASNSRNAQFGTAVGDTFNPNKPTYYVALNFSLDLDFQGKSNVRAAAQADAKAAQLRTEQLRSEAATAWAELQRRHAELGQRIQAAAQLVKIQNEKYRHEQDRLQNGRSTTFQVVNFEQEAAEAELTLLRLNIEQRKIEAQARLFVKQDFGETL